ncbi:FAD-binding domain-containing protein [Parathielavia appendiculata]|uniref:FAD-binding domain-containing protein n=1 Tax=Parathielavia appendiculata TaxID=2587402 RepID=A0AAN6U230_9PEZI|nr:FAD-binding domain-containing protein [Parathielavia appendiculata]
MSPLPSRLVCALHLSSSVLAAAAGLSPFLQPRHDSSCKAVPGSPDWPFPQDWARLNESLAGRLLQPPPPGAVCHPGQATYNATACPSVRAAWSTYEFHQADPVSMDWNQWTNDSCLPQEGAPCSGKGYPVFVINATEARHVQLGVRFAKKHNIRLVVKSSGHDYIGRSNAPNSLSIWTHHLRGIKTHDSFRPSRCGATIDGAAVTVGAGVQMWDLYTALDPLNQTVVGGGGKTVSVGGYVTGAGHSLLSARYGLAADRVLEMEVVTPMGDIVTANECQNQALFWAMRGGGGSTFGIMTSVTIQTVPTPKLESLFLMIVTTATSNPRPIFDMVAYVVSQFPSMGDQGLSGYSYYSNHFPAGNTTVGGMLMSCVLQDSSPEEMRKLWDPVLSHINTTWPGLFAVIYQPTSYPSFLGWYEQNYDTSAAGLNSYLGSRLLDRRALTGDLTKTSEALERFANTTVGTAYLLSGNGVHNAKPRGCGNAVLPAWRKAYVHATTGLNATPLDPASALATREQIRMNVEGLRQLAPDMGAYVNEADYEEPNWQHEFWGSNYKRLLQIKRKVDPDDVLWCHPCVGNERWEQVDDRLCRVKGRKP